MADLLELLEATQQWLIWPVIVLISVHFLWRLCTNVKDNADRFVRRVQEAVEHEREQLIEDIKADLLKTLNKGSSKQQPTPVEQLSVAATRRTIAVNKEKCSNSVVVPPFEYARRLDRKDKSNIVNEIIYQIQSGGDSNRNNNNNHNNCTDDDKVEHEDSAILKDVHRRNVVARMKNLFESNESCTTSQQRWHLNQVVDIISQRTTSMENLRARTLAIPKASSEPPAVRFRRKIRSQQSLSESSIASSFDDILEAERFSKRLSQYSISELLDEQQQQQSPSPQQELLAPDFNRVARGFKTLSTFSLSELLLDDEPDNLFAGVTLRRGPPSFSTIQQHFLRKPVENIDQILIDENLSRCYSQYSISDLVDDEVVFLQDAPSPLIKCD